MLKIMKVGSLSLLLLLSACSFFGGSEKTTVIKLTCSNGGNKVTVSIKDSQPGDSVKGFLQCGGIDIASCTATVAAGASEATCSETSTSNAEGLERHCYDTVVAGNPNPAAYTIICE